MKLILGGGVSGLSAAYYLSQRISPSKIYLVEASNRFGGWIQSKQNGNVLFELGPHTIRPKGEPGANTLQLIEQLNLSNEVIPIHTNHPAAKNRMIYVNKELHLLPSNLYGALIKRKPFSKPLLMSVLSELFQPQKQIPDGDESIYDFIERRFGKDVAEYAISPLICGICAGDAKEISVHFLAKSLFELEQKHGGIIKGTIKELFQNSKKNKIELCNLAKRAKSEKWSVYSLKSGLETLPLTLVNNLQEKKVNLIKNSPCTSLEFHDNKIFAKFKDQSLISDHVISSLLANKTAPLVEKQHPELAEYLYGIPSVTVGVVNIEFKGAIKNDKLNAFGFLVPPSQRIPILGIIFDSCCFPSNDSTVFTVMMGGKWFEEYFGTDPSEQSLLDVSKKYIQEILNIHNECESYEVNILKDCIPQYTVGHVQRIQNIYKYIDKHDMPLTLCGTSYSGVGVNDVILSAKNAVQKVL
ncbi:protoporphyrinogen oxidase [Chrysoperla carnea]|uniref:protoporphyrinogen oxidase n=1 Tax=Chrysoperla carnea TaxID=189513 RepID=UPI001D061716|nr:protoporphyrinogen oxidase [Chrysoperla carnea]